MQLIKTTVSEHVGVITINNDEKRNALSLDLLQEFCLAFDYLEKEEARVVVLTSNPGAQVWSAGLDISELPEPGKDPLPYNHPLEQAMRRIEDFPAPVIAMIEGTVWGGG
ncbi:MAG: enoyl-CoA hydratase/isomerase family protein, partial [Bacteroidales bacterium]|nr:enoyl-CoA hydratase/isomerase family protein [Bacteroidales bacterium]